MGDVTQRYRDGMLVRATVSRVTESLCRFSYRRSLLVSRTSDLFVCLSGQTPGRNVEAAGQPGGPRSHRDPRLTRGRRRVGKWQCFTGATPSPGGKVDHRVCWPLFLFFSYKASPVNQHTDYRLLPDLCKLFTGRRQPEVWTAPWWLSAAYVGVFGPRISDLTIFISKLFWQKLLLLLNISENKPGSQTNDTVHQERKNNSIHIQEVIIKMLPCTRDKTDGEGAEGCFCSVERFQKQPWGKIHLKRLLFAKTSVF